MKGNKEPFYVEPELHREILAFVNGARRREDLMTAPVNEVEFRRHHQDRRRRPSGHESMRHKVPPIMAPKHAEQILQHREHQFPLGFTHAEQLLDVVEIDTLRHIITALSVHLGPASRGAWRVIGQVSFDDDAINVAHGALLRTGKVLLIEAACADGDKKSKTPVWDPAGATQPAIALPDPPVDANLYCCGHAFLSDGRLLAVGGGGEIGNRAGDPKTAWIYDPGSSSWEEVKDTRTKTVQKLQKERWYPTLVTLGHGRTLIASGRSGSTGLATTQMEVYSEKDGTFSMIQSIPDPDMDVDSKGDKVFPQLYPGLHPLPGGKIFYAPVGFATGGSAPYTSHDVQESAIFDFVATNKGKWTDTGRPDPPEDAPIKRQKGMSALLLSHTSPFVQVIAVGGGTETTAKSFQLIDLSTDSPKWEPARALPTNSETDFETATRLNVNVVLLPDGTVFVCGGTSADNPCLLYDPEKDDPDSDTDPWQRMAKLSETRRYHSLALLLPSGEVLATGEIGNRTSSGILEIFSPPYLNKGVSPPKITSVIPNPIRHGSRFIVTTPNAADISKVTLVRPMAVTHQTDSEQRVIPLDFKRSGDEILPIAPKSHPQGLAPEGWYMLFIINNAGVPSVAEFVHLHHSDVSFNPDNQGVMVESLFNTCC